MNADWREMHLFNYVMAGLLIAFVSGIPRAQGQTLDSLGHLKKLAYPSPAFDSLGRPRPLPHSIPVPQRSPITCDHCMHETRRYVQQPGFRIIGADRGLLFMSSVESLYDTASDRLVGPFRDLDASHVDSVHVVKNAEAIAMFGKPYAVGVVIILLNQKGTDAWRKAALDRAAKAATVRPLDSRTNHWLVFPQPVNPPPDNHQADVGVIFAIR